MLREQLNSCLPEDIKTYLAEKAPEKLKKSAELADDYNLIMSMTKRHLRDLVMVIVLLYKIIKQVSVWEDGGVPRAGDTCE